MSGDTDRQQPDQFADGILGFSERSAPSGDTDRAVEAGLAHHSTRCPASWRCRFAIKGSGNYDGSGYRSSSEREADLAAHYEIYSGTEDELRAALAPSRPAAPDSPDQLREALERNDRTRAAYEAAEKEAADRKDWPMADRWRYMASGVSEANAMIRAALSVSPRSDAALDVERLADILAEHRASDGRLVPPLTDDPARLMTPREFARDIAASLSRTPDQEPG